MQEAAAMGIPTVLLDVGGYREMEWPSSLLVPASKLSTRRMRGNVITHYETRATLLARYVNALLDDADHYKRTSEYVRGWAEARSWEKLRGWWESIL
jgi:glycosyltransferase involved in cell wall biosynthesis